MPKGSAADDPFDWGVERVVKELCTPDRTWKPTPRAKLPDPDELAEKIRNGEYDGDLLLSSTEKDILKDLGITRPKFKAALQCAIRQFKSRSVKYKNYQKYLDQTNDDTDSDDDNRQHEWLSEAPNLAFTPVSDVSGPTTTRHRETAQNIANTMQIDEYFAEPPSKKRRLAASAITTTDRASLPQDQVFNPSFIPTEADTLSSNVVQPDNVSSLLNKAISVLPDKYNPSTSDQIAAIHLEDIVESLKSNPGAYWGNGKLPKKPEILDPTTIADADPSVGFGWGEPKLVGRARKKYVHDVVQRYLLYPEGRPTPVEDPILPAYGESDDEDEMNRYIQEEEEEARLEEEEEEEEGILALERSEVETQLKQMVEECATKCREMTLPKEKYKAYTLWNQVRKYGTRRAEVEVLSNQLQTAEKGLEKVLKALKDNQYSSAADLRALSPFLEPHVLQIEHVKWLIRVINSPTAPERIERPRAQVRKELKQRSAKDGIDIWSEDEPEDDLRDFIVEDDLHQEPETPPHGPHRPDLDAMDIDQSDSDRPADPGQSFNSSTDESVEIHDLTNIDHAPSQVSELIDMVISPSRKPGSSQVIATTGASSASEEPPLSDLKAIINKGSLYWETQGDARRLIINILWNQSLVMKRSVLNVVNHTERNECWDYCIEYACINADKASDKSRDKSTRERVWHNTSLLLVRLFNVHVQGLSSSPSPLIHKDYITSLDWVRENKHHFESFWDFFKLIAVYFEAHRDTVANNANSQGQPTPTTERQHQEGEGEEREIEGDEAEEGDSALQFRQRDERRQQEQQKRRLQLRKQVEVSRLPHEKSRLIINESKLDGQNLVYIHPEIAPLIKDHQIDGVRFMWDQLLSGSNQGCLLAHTMGLGKTMQVITLLSAIQDAAKSSDPQVSCQIPDHLKESRTLILCPAGLLNNWMDELIYWAPEGLLGGLFSVDATLSEQERNDTVRDWADHGGVLIIGYTMLTQISKNGELLQLILDKPSIVVGDEAHHLKNSASQISGIANRFKTHTRLALTGSPLANNVVEYYSMIEWVAPGFLGDKKWFSAEYANPISEGLYEDSSIADRRNAKIRLAALRQIVAPKVHRRTVGTLKDTLPPKQEFIVHLDLSNIQRAVYLTYLKGVKGAHTDMNSASLWNLKYTLGILLAHPQLLKHKLGEVQRNRAKNDAKTGYNKDDDGGSMEVLPPQVVTDTLGVLATQPGSTDLKASFKMLVLFKILDEAAGLGENVLVFSQSLPTLNFIEEGCKERQKPYMRLDGSTKVAGRQAQVKEFNHGKGQVFLISTTAGGVGLNIYGASRVVIFDFGFNPVKEQQAIGRAYRIGQHKPVFVYWLICDGTFEKTLHNQQVFKNQLASRVVDKKDLLPKARQITEYFTEPQQAEHQDLSVHRAKDMILDALLDAHEIKVGISSICTTETFEEEDTQQLPQQDQLEAEHLARQTSHMKTLTDGHAYYHQPLQQHHGEVQSTPSCSTSDASLHPQAPAFASAVDIATAASPQATRLATVLDTRTEAVPPGVHPTATSSLPLTNADFTTTAVQAIITGNSRDSHLTNPAASPLPDVYTAEANQQHDTSKLMNSFSQSLEDPASRIPHNMTTARQDPVVSATASNTGWCANDGQLPDQTSLKPGHMAAAGVRSPPASQMPRSMSFDGSPHADQPDVSWPSMASEGSRFSTPMGDLPKGVSSSIMAITQMGNAPVAAASGIAIRRRDNAPITMEPSFSRRSNSAGLSDGMEEFRQALEVQAPSELKHKVPVVVTQLQQHFTGGGLQRSLLWSRLKEHVENQPNRVEVILQGLVPPQNVAEFTKNPRSDLGGLLDGARLPQGRSGRKDPDVRAPHSLSSSKTQLHEALE
ncbi:hypothetical protein SLS53_007280 [Cytospora paraplurivora]|uniref:Uncharacterized protein n=1 Tax=Cytospora paraplurivora TaxID=2898453 RepID=A0AAN9U3U4_9PEZI